MRGVAAPSKVEAYWVGRSAGPAAAEELRELLPTSSGGSGGGDDSGGGSGGAGAGDGSVTPEQVALVTSALELMDRGGAMGGSATAGDSANALRCIHAARMAESAAATVYGAPLGGRFLTALASGADRAWPEGSVSRRLAAKLRAELTEVVGGSLGSDDHNGSDDLLLTLLTMAGRLHPGLAPEVVGPIADAHRGDISTG